MGENIIKKTTSFIQNKQNIQHVNEEDQQSLFQFLANRQSKLFKNDQNPNRSTKCKAKDQLASILSDKNKMKNNTNNKSIDAQQNIQSMHDLSQLKNFQKDSTHQQTNLNQNQGKSTKRNMIFQLERQNQLKLLGKSVDRYKYELLNKDHKIEQVKPQEISFDTSQQELFDQQTGKFKVSLLDKRQFLEGQMKYVQQKPMERIQLEAMIRQLQFEEQHQKHLAQLAEQNRKNKQPYMLQQQQKQHTLASNSTPKNYNIGSQNSQQSLSISQSQENVEDQEMQSDDFPQNHKALTAAQNLASHLDVANVKINHFQQYTSQLMQKVKDTDKIFDLQYLRRHKKKMEREFKQKTSTRMLSLRQLRQDKMKDINEEKFNLNLQIFEKNCDSFIKLQSLFQDLNFRQSAECESFITHLNARISNLSKHQKDTSQREMAQMHSEYDANLQFNKKQLNEYIPHVYHRELIENSQKQVTISREHMQEQVEWAKNKKLKQEEAKETKRLQRLAKIFSYKDSDQEKLRQFLNWNGTTEKETQSFLTVQQQYQQQQNIPQEQSSDNEDNNLRLIQNVESVLEDDYNEDVKMMQNISQANNETEAIDNVNAIQTMWQNHFKTIIALKQECASFQQAKDSSLKLVPKISQPEYDLDPLVDDYQDFQNILQMKQFAIAFGILPKEKGKISQIDKKGEEEPQEKKQSKQSKAKLKEKPWQQNMGQSSSKEDVYFANYREMSDNIRAMISKGTKNVFHQKFSDRSNSKEKVKNDKATITAKKDAAESIEEGEQLPIVHKLKEVQAISLPQTSLKKKSPALQKLKITLNSDKKQQLKPKQNQNLQMRINRNQILQSQNQNQNDKIQLQLPTQEQTLQNYKPNQYHQSALNRIGSTMDMRLLRNSNKSKSYLESPEAQSAGLHSEKEQQQSRRLRSHFYTQRLQQTPMTSQFKNLQQKLNWSHKLRDMLNCTSQVKNEFNQLNHTLQQGTQKYVSSTDILNKLCGTNNMTVDELHEIEPHVAYSNYVSGRMQNSKRKLLMKFNKNSKLKNSSFFL